MTANKAKPLDRSEIDCQGCGERHNIFTGCKAQPSPKKYPGLEMLYSDLGTMKWLGNHEWNIAIDAVREEIRRMLLAK